MARTIQVRKHEVANLSDTVGQHVGRYLFDMSTETRPTFQGHWLPFGRHACQPILGRQAAATFPTLGPPSTVTSGQPLLLHSIFLFANCPRLRCFSALFRVGRYSADRRLKYKRSEITKYFLTVHQNCQPGPLSFHRRLSFKVD